MKTKTILLISFIWFYCPVLIAQGVSTGPTTESNRQEQNVEEITVIGQKELFSLKSEIIRAEDLKYEIFNSLNSTDDFDITCEMRAPINSRIKRRYCDVGFMKKAREEDSRRFLDFAFRTSGITGAMGASTGPMDLPPGAAAFNYLDYGLLRSDQQLVTEFASKTKALNKEMIALAVEHPELATAMVRENVLKQRYLAERREKYKDSILIGHPDSKKNVVVLNELDMLHISFLDHKRGAITDEIWDRWDKWYRVLFRKESYRSMWASANREKYTEEFINYVNAIISEQ